MRGKNNWADADVERGERLARKVYQEIGLRHPLEATLEAIAWRRGARVEYLPLDGAQGRLVRRKKKAILTVSTRIQYEARRRFVIAHELGHHELHEKVMQLDVCDEDKIDEVYDQATEREANAFAAEFLMPAALWRKHVDVPQPTLDVISGLADDYHVSFMSAGIRFVKLSPERCAVAFVKNRKVEWSVSSADLWQRVTKGHVVGSYTHAYDYWQKGTVEREPQEVPTRAWFDRPDAPDVFEQVRPMPSLNAVLVLLWFRPQ
jgi:Zn-dependent peptidase ImmA (M78 family)